MDDLESNDERNIREAQMGRTRDRPFNHFVCCKHFELAFLPRCVGPAHMPAVHCRFGDLIRHCDAFLGVGASEGSPAGAQEADKANQSLGGEQMSCAARRPDECGRHAQSPRPLSQ